MRRLFALVPFALLISACTSTEPVSAPAPVPAPAPAPVESQPVPVSEPDGPEYILAVVSQTGLEHCPNGMDIEWLGVRPTLGWTPASASDPELLDTLMDQPVLARGTAGQAPERPPIDVELKLCPQMQMRSDYVNTPRGIRVRRTERVAADHFQLSSVRRLDELKVEAANNQVVVSFTNPLPFALTGVRLQMHYEGCYGKPGSTSLASKPAATLAPGETLSHSFPRWAEQDDSGIRRDAGPASGPRKSRPPDRQHLAAALVLEIAGSEASDDARVWTDLDVSLSKLGIPFECD